MAPLINERVEQSVNSGLNVFIMERIKQYLKLYVFSMLHGQH